MEFACSQRATVVWVTRNGHRGCAHCWPLPGSVFVRDRRLLARSDTSHAAERIGRIAMSDRERVQVAHEGQLWIKPHHGARGTSAARHRELTRGPRAKRWLGREILAGRGGPIRALRKADLELTRVREWVKYRCEAAQRTLPGRLRLWRGWIGSAQYGLTPYCALRRAARRARICWTRRRISAASRRAAARAASRISSMVGRQRRHCTLTMRLTRAFQTRPTRHT
jgi:hypothetical protein